MARKFMILGILVIVGLISVSVEAFLFSGEMKEEMSMKMPICPGVANLQGEMAITDFDDFCSTVEFIKSQVFANMGIDPNTPISELGTLGKEIQPILDILNNPAQFKELVEKGKVVETVEYGVYNRTLKAVVIRRSIALGDSTIKFVQVLYPQEGEKGPYSVQFYSMQVTKGDSTKGIIFNVNPFYNITASIVYGNGGEPESAYPIGSIEPIPWFSDVPGDAYEIDPGNYEYECVPQK